MMILPKQNASLKVDKETNEIRDELIPVTPADMPCPWCRHPIAEHGSVCRHYNRDQYSSCKCDVSASRLRWKSRRWVRQTNKAIKKAQAKRAVVTKSENSKRIKDLRRIAEENA